MTALRQKTERRIIMTDNSNIISGMLTDADAAELEAFKADVEMAKYMARVEKGELTEEELENRNAMLNFINSPCDLPDELFEKKKGDVCMEREIELINEIIANAIIHGGDWGGPYEVNLENLVLAVNNWLREKGLRDSYHVVEAYYSQTLSTNYKYLENDAEIGEQKTTGKFPVLKIVPMSEKSTEDTCWKGGLDRIP